MFSLSLKTKLVFAITAMVVAIVATLSTLYISEVVHQRIQEVNSIADVIKLHVFAVSKPALGVDLTNSKIDLNDPKQVDAAIQELLLYDTSITSLLDSVTGDSPNILNAVKMARSRDIKVVTFSGFTPDNALRGVGDVNFFVAAKEYGFVEVAHLALCHAVLDIDMGLGKA